MIIKLSIKILYINMQVSSDLIKQRLGVIKWI